MAYAACRALGMATKNTLSRFYRSNERPCIVLNEVNCLNVNARALSPKSIYYMLLRPLLSVLPDQSA
jgi:hypothetical protein